MSAVADLQERIDAAAAVVRARTRLRPEVAIILGTGLGGLVREIAVEAEIPYGDLPGFPLSTVESHAGRLLLGRLRGRVHTYGEHNTPLVVTYHPAYLLRSPLEKAKAWTDLCMVRELLSQPS